MKKKLSLLLTLLFVLAAGTSLATEGLDEVTAPLFEQITTRLTPQQRVVLIAAVVLNMEATGKTDELTAMNEFVSSVYSSSLSNDQSAETAGGAAPSQGESNALRSAGQYLDYTSFSYTGLIGQLEYEGYSTEEATYAADNCGADWNEQAAKSAKSYLDYTSFSRDGLIDQLIYEGFTKEQAEYGAKQNGY